MKTRKLLTLLLALCIALTCLPMAVLAESDFVDSGTCGANRGTNLTWFLTNEGKLIITGSGRMDDYAGSYNPAPWNKYRENITEVYIEYGASYIGNNAFYNCFNVSKVTIPSSVNSIGSYAFSYCNSLTDIPSIASVITLGSGVFSNCISLTEVTVPASISKVPASMFSNCTGLTHVTFSGNITEFGSGVFSQCSALEKVTFKGRVTGTLGNYAFSYCTSLTSFDIPSGVTQIGSYAFAYCSSLNSVTIPNTVESLGDAAFRESGLVSITIPKSVTYIQGNPFSFCDNLGHITIHASTVDSVRNYLSATETLSSVHIIGDAPVGKSGIFGNREEIIVIYYDEGTAGWDVPTWNGYAVQPWSEAFAVKSGSCGNNLTWVLEDNTLTISGSGNMFNYGDYYPITPDPAPWYIYRHRIEHVVVEDGVTGIGQYGFFGLTQATDFAIPDSVTLIDINAFCQATQLTEIRIPDSVQILNGAAFKNCTALTNVTLPDHLATLEYSLFENCTSLVNIAIPDSVTQIAIQVFRDCTSLESVTIPAGVTTMGYFALAGCRSLHHVYFEGDAPSMDSYLFYNTTTTCVYPLGNDTWKQGVFQDYSGNITWEPAPHDHQYEAAVVPPTCTEYGHTAYTCTLCGYYYTDDYVEPIPHNPGETHIENEVPATCSVHGSYEEVTYCTVCGEEVSRKTVETEALPHTYTSAEVDPTCTTPGGVLHTCTVCGYEDLEALTPALGHIFENGFCTVCGQSERALGDVNGDGEIDILDANLVVAWYNEIRELDEEALAAADVNGDGEVDIMDANMIVAYYNEVIDSFPANS